MNTNKKFFLFFLFLLTIACKKELPVTFPDTTWKITTPEEVGVNSEVLKKSLNYLKTHCKKDSLYETIVIKNGYMIFKGDSIHKRHNIYSCTKSFTSTILGLMQEENLLSIEYKIANIDTIYQSKYPNVTFSHLTTMTSGYNAVGQTRWEGEMSEDWSWTPFDPDEPLFPPGTEYAYWDEAMMVFGKMLTVKTDLDLKLYLDTKIMKSIGINSWDWWYESEYQGIPLRNGCTGIVINALDFARVGHLFLNKGNWDGEQLISEKWVEEATINQVPDGLPTANTDRNNVIGSGKYGYNWWVLRKDQGAPVDAYYASGFNHNVCLIIPEWNMVIVRMGDDGNPEAGKHLVYTELLKKLVEGVNF